MQYVQNSHVIGSADQASEAGALLQEHADEDKEEGCGGRELVCGYGVQTDREWGRRDNWGSSTLHIPGSDDVSVRQWLPSGQKEYQKGAAGLGKIRKHIEAGGGGPYHLCGVLQGGDTGGDLVWSRGVGSINGHG